MIKYKFSRDNTDFSQLLRLRVNQYFADNQLSRHANGQMVTKTVTMLAIFLIPFAFILLSGISNIWLLLPFWVMMGFGKAFIGMSVMHDALHGSYTKRSKVNRLIGLSAYMIGANPTMWKIQHNVLHHTYTNIEHADEDISPRFVLRFSPHQPRYWFHKFQHLYATFFYGISVVMWVLQKDFLKLFEYADKGLIARGQQYRRVLTSIILHKIGYFSMYLLLPMLLLPVPPWLVILMYLAMDVTAGIVLTFIFQTAHVMPNSHFVEQEEEKIADEFAVHQLRTTTNYGTRNKILFWFSGGLNFQVEHHLFPEICHIHYPKIAPIVRKTAEEFGLPYHELRGFRVALRYHFSMLKALGKTDYPGSNLVGKTLAADKVLA